jgi:hypothetical protein
MTHLNIIVDVGAVLEGILSRVIMIMIKGSKNWSKWDVVCAFGTLVWQYLD